MYPVTMFAPLQYVIDAVSDKSTDLTVKDIFLHNHNWDRVKFQYRDRLRDVEVEEVEKMLRCKDSSRGFFLYRCRECGEHYTVHFGCNSRLCTHCGKNYTDRWAKNLSGKMFTVPHRHVVLSIPDTLWGIVRRHRELFKVLMDSAIQAINDVFSYRQRKPILAGAIVVLHPFGRDLKFNPHVHALVTEGGFDTYETFVHQEHISYTAMRKTWQYQVLTNFKEALPKTPGYARLIDRLFKEYGEGFYAHLPMESRITSKRRITRYVGRYVRHPAIANYRLCSYDGEQVTFWYEDNDEVRHWKTMDVEDFILALIQHVPDRHFKMIRYYGAYCRKWKGRYSEYLEQESIAQATLDDFEERWAPRCPRCGSPMQFVLYWEPPPPEGHAFGSEINDWNYLAGSSS